MYEAKKAHVVYELSNLGSKVSITTGTCTSVNGRAFMASKYPTVIRTSQGRDKNVPYKMGSSMKDKLLKYFTGREYNPLYVATALLDSRIQMAPFRNITSLDAGTSTL